MKEGPDIALLGSLIGDPARANILTALMSGKALTATELASEAGVTVQTASSHLKNSRTRIFYGNANRAGIAISPWRMMTSAVFWKP